MAKWKGPKLPWAADVDGEHYKAAFDYLSLHWIPSQAAEAVDALRDAKLVEFLPGDLLRAARLEPLPLEDMGVTQEVRKAMIAAELIPLLCVNLPKGIVVADGYHRASAAYRLAPFHKIPLKLADAPDGVPTAL